MALSDDLGLFAHPRPAIVSRSEQELIDGIVRVVEQEQPDEIVVGLPLALSGEDSAQTRVVRALVDRLRERLSIPITTWDERLTSVQAERTVREGRKRTGAADSAAAALVLQAVLDARRGSVA